MRIFVTGGTGFIGSHFLTQALASGHEIVALRRPGATTPIPLVNEPKWIDGRLDDDWSAELEGCDTLVHFAAQGVSPQPTNWNLSLDVNVRQSILLVESALKAGVARIIACGSCMEYGRSGERYDFIPVDAPLEPLGPYATSKAAFSFALGAMARSSGSTFQLFRPFHLYGEGQHESNLWPSIREAALAGDDFPMTPGEQIRDFQRVEDAAALFVKAITQRDLPSRTLLVQNLGSGVPITLKDFAARCWKDWGAKGKILIGKLPYRDNEVMRFVPEIQQHTIRDHE